VVVVAGSPQFFRPQAARCSDAAFSFGSLKAFAAVVSWAICAAVGFGFLFWLLGIRIIPTLGAAQTIWMIRLTSTVLTIAVILLAKQPMGLPRGPARPLALGTGILDTGAFVVCAYGMRLEQVAIISVLGSLYGAVTVALAAIVLREHISRWQWFGIATIFAGIYLISR